MPVQIAFMYGIHPNEIPATQVGELLRKDGSIWVAKAQKIPTHENYENAFRAGADIVIDLHTSGYTQKEETSPYSIIRASAFSTPMIPAIGIRTRTILEKECAHELGKKFGVFYISRLNAGIGKEIISQVVSRNGDLQIDNQPNKHRMEEHHYHLYQTNNYNRVLTVEMWTDWEQMKNGVDGATAERFAEDACWFAKWVKRNSRGLFI